MIRKDQSAKDFLLSRSLNPVERGRVNTLNQYQMELVCLKVLSLLFNEIEVIRVSSFLDHLSKYIQFEISVVMNRSRDSVKSDAIQ